MSLHQHLNEKTNVHALCIYSAKLSFKLSVVWTEWTLCFAHFAIILTGCIVECWLLLSMCVCIVCLKTAAKTQSRKSPTIFSFITPKVSPVAEHNLQVVTFIKCSEDSQQQQYDPQTTSQLKAIHICRDRAREGEKQEKDSSGFIQRMGYFLQYARHMMTDYRSSHLFVLFYFVSFLKIEQQKRKLKWPSDEHIL